MNYVNGFLFNKDASMVVLIQKKTPEWQKDKLNGVGGKIEDGEAPLIAMQREFKEEAGKEGLDWRHFTTLFHSGHIIHFFMAIDNDDEKGVSSKTEEPVHWYFVEDVLRGAGIGNDKLSAIGNLKWLIPLAMDPDEVTATVEDASLPWTKGVANGNTSSV